MEANNEDDEDEIRPTNGWNDTTTTTTMKDFDNIYDEVTRRKR